MPPPVRVERLKVNGKETAPNDGLVISPDLNDLEIDYTALSFTIPERVRFKYKLEGHDSDWRDVGGRRQAYYGGLAPKKYRCIAACIFPPRVPTANKCSLRDCWTRSTRCCCQEP